MQAIFESIFDIFYLTTVISLGLKMFMAKNKDGQYTLFGIMALVLGLGDAFHLIPRSLALNTSGLENWTFSLGFGKMITSITMTIFYLILYYVWKIRYKIKNSYILNLVIWLLSIFRIALVLCPENKFMVKNSPFSWALYRNIPFLILGILIIIIFYKKSREVKDEPFKNLWLTIVLSFGFYVPVVIFENTFPPIGILMIPKTCAYIWTVVIGYKAMKGEKNDKKIF